MQVRSTIILMLMISGAARAQHGVGAPSVRTAPPEASQFSFLIGQWELTVRPSVPNLVAKLHGIPNLAGTWKAWRAFDGFGVEDEMRITDESGNPKAFSHAMRYYDTAARRWSQSSLDVYRGVFSLSTAQWRDGAMTVSSRGTDAEGKPTLSRTIYSDITPNSFHFRQDRSTDNGVTWKEGVLVIDARRVAAAAPR